MRAADRASSISRREFFRRATVATAGASATLLVGEQVWEALERLAPRPLLVPGGLPTNFYADISYWRPACGLVVNVGDAIACHEEGRPSTIGIVTRRDEKADGTVELSILDGMDLRTTVVRA